MQRCAQVIIHGTKMAPPPTCGVVVVVFAKTANRSYVEGHRVCVQAPQLMVPFEGCGAPAAC